jgi:hypothetical protein
MFQARCHAHIIHVLTDGCMLLFCRRTYCVTQDAGLGWDWSSVQYP